LKEIERPKPGQKDASYAPKNNGRGVEYVDGVLKGTTAMFRDITERKRAEEALANERNVLRTLIDNLPDNIFIKDAESRFVTTNPVHVRHLRAKTLEEIVGKTDFDLYPRELAASYYADEQAVIRSGQPLVNREERTIDPEGKTRWLLTTKVPLRDDQGKIIGIVGVNHDITERKRMEEALRESESRYRALFDNASDAILIHDIGGKFLEANHVACERLGYSREEILQMTPEEINSPEYAAHVAERVEELRKRGHAFFEIAHMRRDGTLIPIELSSRIIEYKGRPVVLSIARDITERKRMEEELRRYSTSLEQLVMERTGKLAESERRFRELAELLPQVVFEIDDEGNLTFLNHAGFSSTGYGEDDLRRGLSAFQMFVPQEHDRAKQKIGKLLGGEKVSSDEYTVLRKDGSTFPAIVYAAAVMRENRAVGVRGIVVDITERKHLEAELSKAQRLAAIGETAAMVGHDLRNPLQATTGALYLARKLLKSEKAEERKKAVELLYMLDDQISYMDKIVSDLQSYAAPVEVEPVETNLSDLIQDTLSSTKIPENIEVTVVAPVDLARATVDPVLLKRVLTNLTINAVQAMPKGGKLVIECSKEDESLSVTVRDTGEGVAPENLEKIFNPFFTTKAKGQGLGLAVCKRLVEAQNGTITLKSELGRGSTFTIEIPMNRTPETN
jgi:PAS domain S-box-containing protein